MFNDDLDDLDEFGLPKSWNAGTAVADAEPPFVEEDWVKRGKELSKADGDTRWQLGAWLLYGKHNLPDLEIPAHYGGTGFKFFDYAALITGLTEGHLRDLASTADRVKPSVRSDAPNVTWSHHRMIINELPNVTDDEFKGWLKKVADEDLPVLGLRAAIRDEEERKRKLKGEIKPEPKEKGFIVTVPIAVYEALEDLAKADEGLTLQKVAADVLIEHCASPETQAMREWAKSQGEQRAHDARSENGKRVARNYNPLGLDQNV